MDHRSIGVFDSGLGGLTVVKALQQCLPRESICYFGDTARIPYGTRSETIVTQYSAQCIRFLLTQNVKMVVIACNTASAAALPALSGLFEVPVLGVIEPGAAMAAAATRNGRIGVIGTSGTIKTQAYRRAILALNPDLMVEEIPCPLFVPLVEEGWSDTDIARMTAKQYLASLMAAKVDTLVLGCTHYPLLQKTLADCLGPEVVLINPAEGTAAAAGRILEQEGLSCPLDAGAPALSFFVSDIGQKFQSIGSGFLNREITEVSLIHLEEYS